MKQSANHFAGLGHSTFDGNGGIMNKIVAGTAAILLATTLTTGCSWDKRDTGTAAGAVVGGIAGNLVTGGSAIGTGIGAVGGAVVGNQLAK